MNIGPFTFILERFTDLFIDLFIDEIKFLSTDVNELFRKLRMQVKLAQSYVRDVEEAKEKVIISNVLQTNVVDIMDILHDVEDFLDTFYLDEVHKSEGQSVYKRLKLCFSERSTINKAAELIERYEEICRRTQGYQLPSNFPQRTQRRGYQTLPNITNEDFIVGLEEDVNTLSAKLVGGGSDDTTLLTVVGMGGAGKTTLARKIFKHEKILGHFDSCAWVCVSQEWDTPQLLRKICADFHIPLPENKTSVPLVELKEFLQRGSCLVALDDVWKKEALQELLPSLCAKGSKFFLTTRNKEIVDLCTLSGVYIHEARRLTSEESWDLFSKIVRNNWHGIGSFEDESRFAMLGKEMLRECQGLPLAIVALAGLLRTKSTIQEWKTMKDNVMSRIMGHNKCFLEYGAVKEMLELSYLDLPYNLKPCFLYLGIFEEDEEVNISMLTLLWIGEGFLGANQCNENRTLEKIAEDFLDELVHRCMVQVVSREYDGKVNCIRIHDLMRDLCIEKAKELRLFEISTSSVLTSTSTEPLSRRAIIHKGDSFSIN